MWTPEDQADFEARHPENRAVNQTQPQPSAPPAAQAPKVPWAERALVVMGRLTVWTAIWGLGGWAVAWLLHLPNFVKPIIGVPFAVVIFAWIPVLCIGLVWSGLTAGKMAHEAMQPLPSLQEIDAQLRWEGFNPTVSDCAAVQQRMQSENVMKLAVAGAFFVLL